MNEFLRLFNSIKLFRSSKYEFENYISLTGDSNYLQKRLKELKEEGKIKGNIDIPESVYTSVLQAATCKDVIGWSPFQTSTKLIFVATDSFPKTAGDGRNMGIVRRYINKCQLDENGGYQRFRDYPDDNVLMEELGKNDIQLIFLVKSNITLGYYQQISNDLSEIKSKAKILVNSEEVVEEIQSASKQATYQVNIIPPYKDDYTEIKISSDCEDKNTTSWGALECKNTGSLELQIFVRALKCYPNGGGPLNYAITLVGFGKIELELSTGCECECTSLIHPSYEFQSEICTTNGDLICGECNCYEDYSGKYCQCHESTSKCVQPGDQPGLLCNGVGECECNACVCGNPKSKISIHSGQHCEYDNSNCQSGMDEFCSGDTRGKCDGGKCVCEPQYMGDICEQRNCTHRYWNQTCVVGKDPYVSDVIMGQSLFLMGVV